MKGFLFGVGTDPIPPEFYQGKMIPAFVVIYDQSARPYLAPIEL